MGPGVVEGSGARSGNRCGHSPAAPALALPAPPRVGLGGHPRILTTAAERLDEYYWAPVKVIPSLNAAHEGPRRQRSERREACIRLAKCLLKFCDLATMRVGIRPGADPRRLDLKGVEFLADQSGLTLRRAERALHDLQVAGLVFVREVRELQPDGGYRSFVAIKTLARDMFTVLGLSVALELERKKAKKRLEERIATVPRQEPSPADLARARMFRTTLFRQMKVGVPVAPRPRPAFDEENRRRRWNAEAMALRREHPDWPYERVKAEADARIRN